MRWSGNKARFLCKTAVRILVMNAAFALLPSAVECKCMSIKAVTILLHSAADIATSGHLSSHWCFVMSVLYIDVALSIISFREKEPGLTSVMNVTNIWAGTYCIIYSTLL